jgi:thioredoxin reductase (NADPH)
MKEMYDTIIIGTGIVGLSAGVYCGRLKLKTLIIGKEQFGTLAKTDIVENYPGFKKISGPELTEKVFEHAKNYDIEIINSFVEEIKNTEHCFEIKTKKETYNAKTILFATGSAWRKLGVPGEEEFKEKGVHYCALCDGPLYKNKILAVAGGGDSAVKEALLLSSYAKKVYILARSTLKPEPINKERLKQEKNIQAIEGIEVKEIKGDKFVNKLILTKEINNSKELKVDGLFVDI